MSVTGDSADYSCRAGLQLKGTAKRECVAGQWNGIVPECIRR